jgi:Type III secretion protein YscO.
VSDVLRQVLDVKNYREANSASAVRQAQYRVEEATRAVSAARREVEEYRTWRVRREQELYDSIIDQHIKLRDLDELKEHIGLLREKEQALHQRVATAEGERKKAVEALEAARQNHRLTLKEKEKIQILWDKERDRRAAAAAHTEESELEEFRVRGREPEERYDYDQTAR